LGVGVKGAGMYAKSNETRRDETHVVSMNEVYVGGKM
jgi:hypothetical protein